MIFAKTLAHIDNNDTGGELSQLVVLLIYEKELHLTSSVH